MKMSLEATCDLLKAERDCARQEERRAKQDLENRRVELCSALGIDLKTGWSDAMFELTKVILPFKPVDPYKRVDGDNYVAVLDCNNKPINKGDTVYYLDGSGPYTVTYAQKHPSYGEYIRCVKRNGEDFYCCYGALFTHENPKASNYIQLEKDISDLQAILSKYDYLVRMGVKKISDEAKNIAKKGM